MKRGLLLFTFAALSLSTSGAAQTLDQAISDLRAGAYESAIDALGEISRSEPGPNLSRGNRRRAYVAYLSALAEVGRYEDALEAVSQAPPAIVTELANTAGEILYELGQIDRAREQFVRAVQGGAVDRNSARLNLAIIEWRYGDRDAAFAAFDSFIDLYNASTPLSSTDLTAVATAVQYLGIREHELFQDALRAYDEAVAADPGTLEPRVLIGELFLDKYNGPEADAALREVLERNPNHPRALLGLARAMKFNGTVGVMDQVEAALEQNENLTAARVFKARLHLEVENHDDARAELEKALEVNPVSLEALSVLAASHYLRGENGEYGRIRDQVTALSPAYAELYNDVADLSVQSRKYVEAARLAQEAIAVDSLSWRAYGILGMNQLRLGLIEEGRASLETAFEGDPYSVWFYNTLDLLDTFENYDTNEEDPRFLFVLHGRESALLQPYIEAIAAEAYEAWWSVTADTSRPCPSESRSIRATPTFRSELWAWRAWALSASPSEVFSPWTRPPPVPSEISTGRPSSGTNSPTSSTSVSPSTRSRAGSPRAWPYTNSVGPVRVGATNPTPDFSTDTVRAFCYP